jgi:hypothetical protein
MRQAPVLRFAGFCVATDDGGGAATKVHVITFGISDFRLKTEAKSAMIRNPKSAI